MAFDQSTRGRLQKFVTNCRDILSEEFERQLQSFYGMDQKTGLVANVDELTHLDNRQRQTAHLLREMLMHYLVATPGKNESDRTKQVLDRIVREQAFTVLNRLAALRIAESRGFLLESVAKAHSSKGFQLYRHLSGTAHGETGDAYCNYLFSLFDEIGLDLAVLFDRHSAQGRLFPRESALLELLAEINHHEIQHLWLEDETIGWIYQYFNSQNERKKMRAASQAPRNSRELAVRNQFFTPRYVVEFLTDNTLGRIWYEMTEGNTNLLDSCQYLLRRPTELFLKSGETAPERDLTSNAVSSREELLKKTVYIPFRPIKDPRNIRLLDPACGSMHFGLYAFDLFERIYQESWDLEQKLGPDVFVREPDQRSLQDTFGSLEDFQQQIPKLIIEHNIHGVDIDSRAVQIAGLSLWLRAQRAWFEQGLKPKQRPTIVKSNIVCAEPMPGERMLLRDFTSRLNPPVLGQLLEVIFDKMQLAGEAGALLKIEEEIQATIHEAREQWLQEFGNTVTGDMFQSELNVEFSGRRPGFDLEGIDDDRFWDSAEQLILKALNDFSEQVVSTADQKRLFAEDAAKGFGFIDLCRREFDAVVMNPPFGKPTPKAQVYNRRVYPGAWVDIYGSFLTRFMELKPAPFVGAITSSLFLYTKPMRGLRESWVKRKSLSVFVELGGGVLDAATVETALTVSTPNENDSTIFVDLTATKSFRDESLLGAIRDPVQSSASSAVDIGTFGLLALNPFCYHLGPERMAVWSKLGRLDPDIGTVTKGNQTFDDFRFQRLRWEVPPSELNLRWYGYEEGGDYQPFLSPTTMLYNWEGDGREARAFQFEKYGTDAQVRQSSSWWWKFGITYPRVSSIGFGPRIMPSNNIFSGDSISIFLKDEDLVLPLLAILCSTPAQELIYAYGRYRKIEVRAAANFPISESILRENIQPLTEYANRALQIMYSHESTKETSPLFIAPSFNSEMNESFSNGGRFLAEKMRDLFSDLDEYVRDMFFGNDELSSIAVPRSGLVDRYLDNGSGHEGELAKQTVGYFIGVLFGRWDIKLANASQESESQFSPFEPLPANPPGTLDNDGGRVSSGRMGDYPIDVVSAGIVSCASDGSGDLLGLIDNCIEFVFGDRSDYVYRKLCSSLNVSGLLDFFLKTNGFFDDHLKKYSDGRRQAPIYWPLQTSSGSYTLWVYYHRLNDQVLYTCVNDFVDPRLKQVQQDLDSLRSNSARSNQEEKELERFSDFANELRDFRDELLRLAKIWRPNLNDGVQITAAPMWKLFQHNSWQKKLKETWEKLEKGEYDWAHLALSIWPERVLRKCHQDRSLAITHDVEAHFWNEVEVPIKRGQKPTGETKLEWQPKDLDEVELTALVNQLAAEVE